MGDSRRVAAAVAVAGAAVLVGIALVTSGGDGSDGDRLRVERTQTALIVYLRDPADNSPVTAGGARSVTVECVDSAGELVISAPQAWPFSDTDGGTLDPHVHLRLDPGRIGRVDRCRLRGTDLEGGVL
jgi:hypothetical protein